MHGADGAQRDEHLALLRVKCADRLRRAHVGTEIEGVLARLEQVAAAAARGARVVEGGEVVVGAGEQQQAAFARLQQRRLGEGGEHARGLAQTALRRLHVQLRDLPARGRARVVHAHGDGKHPAVAAEGLCLHRKVRIREAEAEGEEHAVARERFKIAIADVDILFVIVELFAPEAERRGVVAVAHGDGVRQFAARADGAGEHVDEGVPALHAPLPCVDEGGDLVAVAADEGEVDDVAAVEHDDRLFEGGRDRVEHGALFVGQVIAPLFRLIFAVLARRAAEDDQRDLARARRAFGEHAGDGHFGIVHGPMPPPAVVGGVVRLGAPAAVHLQQVGVGHQPPVRGRFGDRLGGGYLIRRVDVAAAAVADVKIIELAAPEYRDARAAAQGQGAVVLQKDDAVRRGLPQQRRRARRYAPLAGGLRLFLHQAVAHRLVHDEARDIAEEFADGSHVSVLLCRAAAMRQNRAEYCFYFFIIPREG